MQKTINSLRNTILPATLNSYSVIFFFNNRLFALVLMAVSFFNFFAGLTGFIAALTAVIIANSMGFNKIELKKGLFSFNALLVGIGMGTFFDPSFVFFSLLLLAALLSLILSVTLAAWLGKYGLPHLSIPFVVTFWFIMMPAAQFENLGLTQRNIYWINEVYALGGNSMLNFFQTINTLPVNKIVDIYFRSMSSIFFQDNLIAGFLVATALLVRSRIAFSLSVIGFLSAYFFAQFTGSDAASITYYNIGANYVMVAIAIGAFFVIPSKYSYLWAVLLVPLTSLVLLFMSKFFGYFQLQVFSLPFSFVVILFVYFLHLRLNPSKLQITPLQHYSPEVNLYTFTNNKERLANLLYFPLYLPFWGEWTVTQAHNGKHTHKGDWGHAFDFMLRDDEAKTYATNGLLCEDYYCYNKPVLACADGIVEEIIDHIDDNEIGKINTANNWGNTIVIRHLSGLYTQLSHLKKGAFKVAKGDFVKQGDLLALCGNSGRSPEPHLHVQVQTSPLVGSRTIDYPFAYYHQKEHLTQRLHQFSRPLEGAVVSGISITTSLKTAFDILPNTLLEYSYANQKGEAKSEVWEAYTDAYNNKYLYCRATESTAFYVNDGSMFYFTSFNGDTKSLLYYFYLSAYRVCFCDIDRESLTDAMPLIVVKRRKFTIWLHDFIAPFYPFIRVWFSQDCEVNNNPFVADELTLKSKVEVSIFGRIQCESTSQIVVKEKSIYEFSYHSNDVNIKAVCINS